MTGSSLVPIVVPIAAAFGLAVWLGLVLYAADHPLWKKHRAPRAGSATGTAAGPDDQGQVALTGPGADADATPGTPPRRSEEPVPQPSAGRPAR